MTEFTFDTTGLVTIPLGTPKTGDHRAFWAWEDFTPFEQGYIKALFASGIVGLSENSPLKVAPVYLGGPRPFAFSDLAPETLDAIRKDCAIGAGLYAAPMLAAFEGADLWERRQRGDFLKFPMTAKMLRPLTPYLGDDSKIYLRATS